jgi:carboxymethylenebutenolidase
MGETVSFASNGDTAGGYLALPASGSGPGVMVVQEWWGLVPQIKKVCDRLAGEGFVALAPDLYHGEIAEHTEMDKAGQLMSTLPMDRAARDMGGAVDFLLGRAEVQGAKIGVVGYCMGGMLTLMVAAQQGDKIGAAAPYYGAPLGDSAPDWSGLTAPVRGHYADSDDFFPPDAIAALEGELRALGKDVELRVHPGCGHAFMNDADVFGTYDGDLATQCWAETAAFLHERLDQT